MTVVSDSDLWMFVSSTGALTAGRVDVDHALFPYETDDRIHRSAGLAGPVTLIARMVDGERQLWQPYGPRPAARTVRSIAKSVLGDRLVFEEHHRDWSLLFRATWAPSDVYGWVRTVELLDTSGVSGPGVGYELLDGFLDVMPAGVDAHTEQIRSNLVDAYKRSETGPWGSAAVYSLEALITDRTEPAEALTATVIWSTGLPDAELDLDGRAVDDMIAGRARSTTPLLTGRPGAVLEAWTDLGPGCGFRVLEDGGRHRARARGPRPDGAHREHPRGFGTGRPRHRTRIETARRIARGRRWIPGHGRSGRRRAPPVERPVQLDAWRSLPRRTPGVACRPGSLRGVPQPSGGRRVSQLVRGA